MNEDRCESCEAVISEDDYLTEPDGYEEFWGAKVARPDIVTGYKCPECGYEGEF